MILCRAEESAKAVAARVCPNWNPIALDYLWKDLEGIIPLLWLLISETESGSSASGPRVSAILLPQ